MIRLLYVRGSEFATLVCGGLLVAPLVWGQTPAAPAPLPAHQNSAPVEQAVPQDSQPAPDPHPTAPDAGIQYQIERPKRLNRLNGQQIEILEKLNRVDRRDLGDLKRIVVPNRWDLPVIDYSPLPRFVPGVADHAKAIIVDLPGQVFGAYENGRLVRWGPVNTGKGNTPTPPGLYHLNWKSRLRISSVNPQWKMPYYFNFSNYMGLGMHEYQMPGYPASHGCVRMLPQDAEWLYNWGEGRDIVDGQNVASGTPVWIVGQYKFGDPKPWLQPGWLAHGVELPAQLMTVART